MVTLVRNAMAKNIEYLIDKGTCQKKSVENSKANSIPIPIPIPIVEKPIHIFLFITI